MPTTTPGSGLERAAAWLRLYCLGPAAAPAPDFDGAQVAAVFQAEAEAGALDDAVREEIDIACWPALVAPFYD